MIPKSTFALPRVCSKQFFPSLSYFFCLTGTVSCGALLANYFQFFPALSHMLFFFPGSGFESLNRGIFCFFIYLLQHCFICRLLDTTVWTVATSALAARWSNHMARLIHNSARCRIIALTYDIFPALGHWELSHMITTHHLLSLLAVRKSNHLARCLPQLG